MSQQSLNALSAGALASDTRATGNPSPFTFRVQDDPAPSIWPHFLQGQTEHPVRVILIDDDPHIRQVIAHELLSDRRTDLLGQAGSLRQGVSLIAKLEFDVMIVDLNLGDGSGFDLIERAHISRPKAQAIVISITDDDEHALHAFDLGATGYLVKDSWFGSFSQAVLQVANGGASITPNLARRLLRRLRPISPLRTWAADGVKYRLSARELQVLKMVASGYTNIEIGAELGISGQTVNGHVRNIYRKLRVHNRVEASTAAVQGGLV